MKNGIQIEIQSDLNKKEDDSARQRANEFILDYIKDGMKIKGTNGGWHSFFRRGTIGLKFDTDNNLYLRRASKHRRIYQIIKESELKTNKVIVDGREEYTTKHNVTKRRWHKDTQHHNGCICPNCSAQIKSLNKYGEIPTYIYATIGDIKG